jgi:WD40 repeat protein
MPALKHPDWLPMSRVWCLAFSADGKYLAVGGNFLPSIWEFKTGELVRDLSGTNDLKCSSISFSPDGERVAATFLDGVRVWESQSGKSALAPRKQHGNVPSAAFSPDPDGQFLAICRGGEVTIENIRPRKLPTSRTLAGSRRNRRLAVLAFSADGLTLAARAEGEDQEIVVWDVSDVGTEKLRCRSIKPSPKARRACLAFRPGSNVLVSGCAGKPLEAWDALTGRPVTLNVPAHDVSALAFSPDGRYLATTDGGNRVAVWDADSGQLLRILEATTSELRSLAFDPSSGKFLAAGGSNGFVKVWEAVTGREKCLCRGHHRNVACVCFSPDGKRLATASSGTVCLWDAGNGRELFSMVGHGAQVEAVAFSPDGRRLASCSMDGDVKLWDPSAGHEVLTLKDHRGPVMSVAFAPGNGQLLASCGHDDNVRLWDGRPLE